MFVNIKLDFSAKIFLVLAVLVVEENAEDPSSIRVAHWFENVFLLEIDYLAWNTLEEK